MTFGFALAGLSHDYHFSSFKVVVATLLVTSHDDKSVAVSSPVAHARGSYLTTPSPPIHIKPATTLAALECVLAYRVIEW